MKSVESLENYVTFMIWKIMIVGSLLKSESLFRYVVLCVPMICIIFLR